MIQEQQAIVMDLQQKNGQLIKLLFLE